MKTSKATQAERRSISTRAKRRWKIIQTLIKFENMTERTIRKIIFIILLSFAVFLAGCSQKPEIITRTVYQDVYLPIKCEAKIPDKPKFDENSLESAKAIAKYYEETERLLRECIGGMDAK